MMIKWSSKWGWRAKRSRSDLLLSNLIPTFRWPVLPANFSFREARPASMVPWIVRAAQTCRAGRNHCRNEETNGTLLVVTRHYCGAYSCFSFFDFSAAAVIAAVRFFPPSFRPCALVLSSHLRNKALSVNADILAEQGLGWVINLRFPANPYRVRTVSGDSALVHAVARRCAPLPNPHPGGEREMKRALTHTKV